MELLKCKCCGDFTIEEYDDYEICSTCGWQDDDVQNDDPEFWGGANELCLREYREKWVKSQTVRGVFIYEYKTRERFPLKIKWTEEQKNVLMKHEFSFNPLESMKEEQFFELCDMAGHYMCGCVDDSFRGISDEGVILDDIIDVFLAVEREFIDKFLEDDEE